MEKTGGSRLLQMQARFQQKQMQEKELKIASLYEAQQARALDRVRHSPTSGGSVASAASEPTHPPIKQPGKVRQMFEERRTKGIDKSYPLKPIQNTERQAARRPLPNGYSKVTSTTSTTSSRTVEKKSTLKTKTTISLQNVKKQSQSNHHKLEKITNGNGNGDVNHNHVETLNSSKNALNHIEEPIPPSTDELDKDNNDLLENETFPEAMAPEPTPRSAERRPERVDRPERPPRKSPTTPAAVSPMKPKPQPQPTPAAPPRRSTPTKAVPGANKPQGAMLRKATQRSTAAAGSAGGGAGGGARAGSGGAGAPCAVCGRRFAPDRLATHESICRKHANKKRKPFDALKHRLAGTEAEPFIGKLRKVTASSTKASKPLNNSWRQKHEEFIQSIRAAKQVQAHLNAGGKLSDLPPPPPSENPDYVACPHCGRRFNQAAADRHIPKCANYQFNKPKPGTAAKKR